jgi:prepilin-type N-terminal cleavage/methylation domain-containing protein
VAPRERTSDDGFTIVEVVVAVVILALAVTVLAGLMTKTLGLAQSNTQRTTAANLATQQVEKLQTMRALDIPDGRITIGPITVGGTPYTIFQSSKYVTVDGSACSGTTSSDLTSKVVTLRVTWPNMGNVKSVRSATIRALGTGSNDLSSTTGAAAVAVQNAMGDGTAGIAVTLLTAPGGTVVGTQTSGDDGCVVFAGLPPGNYTASANTAGYVNLDGVQATAGAAFGVTASTVTKAVLPYDLLGGLDVRPTSPNGAYAVPNGIGVTLTTSIWSPSQNRVYTQCVGAAVQGCVSGSSDRLAASLFPASYGAWAGTCADETAAAAAAGTTTLQPVTSGATTSYTASNFGLVNATISAAPAGRHLYAVHAPDASCASGEVFDLGAVSFGQVVKVALPWGTWRLQFTSTGNVSTQTVTLASSVPAAQGVAVFS